MDRKRKTGGRAKGTLNKSTAEFKERIRAILNKELDGLDDLFDGLEKKEKLDFIVKLLPFVVAKQQAHEINGDQKIIIDFKD